MREVGDVEMPDVGLILHGFATEEENLVGLRKAATFLDFLLHFKKSAAD